MLLSSPNLASSILQSDQLLKPTCQVCRCRRCGRDECLGLACHWPLAASARARARAKQAPAATERKRHGGGGRKDDGSLFHLRFFLPLLSFFSVCVQAPAERSTRRRSEKRTKKRSEENGGRGGGGILYDRIQPTELVPKVEVRGGGERGPRSHPPAPLQVRSWGRKVPVSHGAAAEPNRMGLA